MEIFTYKGISAGKYIEGELEALNLDEASHVLKEKKIIISESYTLNCLATASNYSARCDK